MLKITKRLQQPFCAALVALLMTATPAQAWTRTGHAAIGFVAEAKLKADNRAVWNTISELLDGAEFYDEAVTGCRDRPAGGSRRSLRSGAARRAYRQALRLLPRPDGKLLELYEQPWRIMSIGLG